MTWASIKTSVIIGQVQMEIWGRNWSLFNRGLYDRVTYIKQCMSTRSAKREWGHTVSSASPSTGKASKLVVAFQKSLACIMWHHLSSASYMFWLILVPTSPWGCPWPWSHLCKRIMNSWKKSGASGLLLGRPLNWICFQTSDGDFRRAPYRVATNFRANSLGSGCANCTAFVLVSQVHVRFFSYAQ